MATAKEWRIRVMESTPRRPNARKCPWLNTHNIRPSTAAPAYIYVYICIYMHMYIYG